MMTGMNGQMDTAIGDANLGNVELTTTTTAVCLNGAGDYGNARAATSCSSIGSLVH